MKLIVVTLAFVDVNYSCKNLNRRRKQGILHRSTNAVTCACIAVTAMTVEKASTHRRVIITGPSVSQTA